MKKIFFWSPYLSNVATIKNVLNSAMSMKKYNKKSLNISILDVIGEWSKYEKEIQALKINLIKMPGFKLDKFFPIEGFLKSRIIFFLIFFFKFFSLRKIIKYEKPEYFIIHLLSFLPFTLMIFSNFETRFILRISGLPKLTILRKLFWKIISKKIYMVTCPSYKTKQDLLKMGIFPEKILKTLYDPIIDVDKINKNLMKTNKYNFSDKKYFLNIGRLTKQKNQLLLLKAFSKISNSNKDLNLVIVGEGEERSKLESYIKSKNLGTKVFLVGYTENVYPLIKKSIAIISSSLWEDPGAVMIEASYCNKNVISSNCPNGPEEFLSSDSGNYLFRNNDVVSLINKINCFLNDDENKKFLQILSCKKKSRNYTIFKHYKRLVLLLKLN
ncbi:glycosyltransferase [Candidatus Pelagibacter communis]|uniref:glycosyltransferase n=1 Tax=Pelagibacter ubique TaxID=198252 RepID=UPI00094D59C9|nr:glycosyltransferase [Candidatus Pelagibacter ubique]